MSNYTFQIEESPIVYNLLIEEQIVNYSLTVDDEGDNFEILMEDDCCCNYYGDTPFGVLSVTGVPEEYINNSDPRNPVIDFQAILNLIAAIAETDPVFQAWLATNPLADFITDELDPVFVAWLASNPLAGFITQDTVLEYDNLGLFPPVGTAGIIYVANNNATTGVPVYYIWNGSTYVTTAQPVTGITGTGTHFKLPKFDLPQTLIDSNFSDNGTSGRYTNPLNLSQYVEFMNSASAFLRIARAQSKIDFYLGNAGFNVLSGMHSDQALEGFMLSSDGDLLLSAGSTSVGTGPSNSIIRMYINRLTGNIGIGTGLTATERLHVQGNFRLTGALLDRLNAPGTLGFVLKSTNTGVEWVSLPSLLSIDAVPVNGSANAVSSDGVFDALALKLDASAYNDRYKGKYTSLVNLQVAHPTSNDGDYAIVDAGIGSNAVEYIWDSNEGWVQAGSAGATTTDTLPEGATNLYFTAARVRAVVLTGLSLVTGTPVTALDSFLVAIGKLQTQITNLTTIVSGKEDKLTFTAVKTASYNPAINEVVLVDLTAGSQNDNMPNAPADGVQVGFKILVQPGSVNTLTMTCTGGATFNTVGGATTATISVLNQVVIWQYKAAANVWIALDTSISKTYIDAMDALLQPLTGKDATGGYVGLTLFKINFKNAANTFTSFLTNSNTAARTYLFQDKDYTVADNADVLLRKKRIISDAVLASVSGTTANTLVKTYEVTVGTLSTLGFIDLFMYSSRSGTSSGHTVSIYINTTNSFGTSTLIASAVTSGNFNPYLPFRANFVLRNNLITGGVFSSASGSNFVNSSTGVSVACNNTSSSVWFFVSLTPTNSGQTIYLEGVEMIN